MKHRIPQYTGKTGFPFPFTRIHRLTANEKDFSLSLEMTHGAGSPLIIFHTARNVRQTKKDQSHQNDWFFTSLPRMGKGDRVSGARVLSYATQMRLSFPYTTFCLSYHVCPIRPCGAPSPLGEGCDTRIPSSKTETILLNARKRGCEITIISFSRSICRGGLAALIGVTGKPYPSCLSCHSHPIRPFRAPSPRGEGCDTRIPSSKKGGEAAT